MITSGQVDVLERLVMLASQYGPFLFAMLYTILVPYVGQRWFASTLKSTSIGNEDREKAIKLYAFYWISGVILGLVLVILSAIWWIYVQLYYSLPQSQQQNISNEISLHVYTGVIQNVNSHDMFFESDDPEYKIYLAPVQSDPTLMRFAIIFQVVPPANHPINLKWAFKQSYERLREADKGYNPWPMQFCLRRTYNKISLMRDADGIPHFEPACGVKSAK
jgi:hypothetical protein